MKTADMIRMANQITTYFKAFPERDAVDGIAGHIHEFWEPRMRAQLFTHADAGGDGLTPLFIQAVAKLKSAMA